MTHLTNSVTRADRLVKFHLIGPYPGDEVTGIRGWCSETEDRYEISEESGKWSCSCVIDLITDPEGWGFREIATDGDLFSCMVAAEQDAINQVQALAAQQLEDHG